MCEAEAQNWRIIRAAIHEVDRQNRGVDQEMGDDDILELVMTVVSSLALDEERVRRVALGVIPSRTEKNYKKGRKEASISGFVRVYGGGDDAP